MDRESKSEWQGLPTPPRPLPSFDVGAYRAQLSALPPTSSLPDQLDANATEATHSNLNVSASPSTSSSNVPPHLKRKHGHKHMRQQLHEARATLQSSTHLALPGTNPSPALGPLSPSQLPRVQLTRSNTAPSPKRPPASHSSNGVETTAGPPPSFDTRRTQSQEKVWRVDRSKSLRITPGPERPDTTSQTHPQSLTSERKESSSPDHPSPETPLLVQSSPETADTQSVPTPTDAEEVPAMEIRRDHGLGLSNSEVDSKTSSDSHKSEDLFLNIARVDAARPSSSRGDKRRSRISLPFFSSPRPATSYNPESAHMQADSSITTPRAEVAPHHIKRASLQFGQVNGLDQASDQGSTDASNSGRYSKRSSTLYADTIKPLQRPTTTLRSSRLVSEGGYLDRPKFAEKNTTESTASTTAPSTVWDELDDLKSRIRKLELTGKLPPSSAAAMTSAERPRTATTAATTISGSPKHSRTPANLQSAIEGIPSSLHPLLHEALDNAKTTVSYDVYQKLRNTAQDALQLASMTSPDGQNARSAAPMLNDRQIRRRTESLCRSLTELAITLAAESKAMQQTLRPGSREYHASPSTGLRSRRYSHSNEPADRPPISTRVQSRLESRRVSAQVGYTNPRHTSPDVETPTTLSQNAGSGSRSTRISTGRSTRRTPGFLDGANDEDLDSPSIRPISRALTDVNPGRRVSRDHAAASREYTSQHPMPSKSELPAITRTPLPSNVSTNFISRRKYPSPAHLSTADSSPLASRQSWGHISVVHQDRTPSDTVSEAPGSGRSITTRRSFGLASRISSSMGNRLRSARSERTEPRSLRDSPISKGDERTNLQTISTNSSRQEVNLSS